MVTVTGPLMYCPMPSDLSGTASGPRCRAGSSSDTWICAGRYGFPALLVTDTRTWLVPRTAGVIVTLTLPRPPGPPVLNATAALAVGLKVSRAVAVLTSSAVTASTAVAISASAATDQRSRRSVTAERPESGDDPFAEPLSEPLEEPLNDFVDRRPRV